jgi:hypothetical protein
LSCECGAEPSKKDKAIEVQGVYDGVLIWKCGECGRYRPRFTVPSRLYDRAVDIIDGWNRLDAGEG